MKTKIVIWSVTILCVIAISCATFGLYSYFSHKQEPNKGCLTVNIASNRLISSSDEIKILQLSDIQLQNSTDFALALDVTTKTIQQANPDLIVLTGDNVDDNANEALIKKLVDYLDSFRIPWTLVMGNHDYNSISMSKQCEIYQNGKYCLFKQGTIQNSYGNYYYNIERNGQIIYSLVFMDAGRSFDASHVTWYENTLNKISIMNGGKIVPSLLFFHIPVEETSHAYNLYLQDPTIGSGVKNEEFCIQSSNVGMFAKAKELNSTKAFIYGHDHINNLILDYQGIKLCYGLKSSKTSYYYNTMLGGNLFTIKANNSFEIKRIYAQ